MQHLQEFFSEIFMITYRQNKKRSLNSTI